VTDGVCQTTTTTIAIKPGNACTVGDLCDYCMGPKSGSNWQGEMIVIWDTETSLAQLNYEATNLVSFEVIEWTVTFNVSSGDPVPANATLNVTRDKVTGKGGEGYYTFAGGTKLKITSADIDLEFVKWNVKGSLVVRTDDGKTTTVEISGASCMMR
jgi:RNA polymerase subunit RPABC4/transcription elongation factor Spt4